LTNNIHFYAQEEKFKSLRRQMDDVWQELEKAFEKDEKNGDDDE
jgi:hypothetical protein